jgi:hypothetical protein
MSSLEPKSGEIGASEGSCCSKDDEGAEDVGAGIEDKDGNDDEDEDEEEEEEDEDLKENWHTEQKLASGLLAKVHWGQRPECFKAGALDALEGADWDGCERAIDDRAVPRKPCSTPPEEGNMRRNERSPKNYGRPSSISNASLVTSTHNESTASDLGKRGIESAEVQTKRRKKRLVRDLVSSQRFVVVF